MLKTLIPWNCRLVAALAMALAAGAEAFAAFEKIPQQARKELKGVRGKKVRTGFVFVEGQYVPPPYVVARMGNGLFVNGKQVTGQVVPWKQFLATQPGAAALLSETKSEGEAAKPKAAEADSVDDLFDDGGSEAPAEGEGGGDADAAGGGAEEALPNVDFAMNSRARMLLKQIDEARTRLDKQLRTGAVCFLGSKYPAVTVPQRMARQFMDFFPEAMRDSNGVQEMLDKVRSKGYPFIRRELCKDLLEHRADYLRLMDRRQKDREADELQQMLNNRRK